MKVLILLVLSFNCVWSQIPPYIESVDFDKVQNTAAIVYKNGKAGLIRIDGSLLLPCEHKHIGLSSEGYIVASKYNNKKELKYGFYDLNGEQKIPFIYDGATYFQHGLASVKIGEKWGFINTLNQLVIDTLYTTARHFSSGYALVEEHGEKYFIDTLGEQAFEKKFENGQNFKYDYAKVRINGTRTFIDSDGYNLAPVGCEVSYIYPAQNMMEIKQNGKIGYSIISTGEITIPAEYEEGNGFYHSAITTVMKKTPNGFKIAVINKKGELLSDFIYDTANSFYKNRGIVGQYSSIEQHAMYFGAVDLSGKLKIPIEYDLLTIANYREEPEFEANSKSYFITKKNKHFGVIDEDGKIIIPIQYKSIIYNNNGYFRCVDIFGKNIIMNYRGIKLFDTTEILVKDGIVLFPGLHIATDVKTKLKGVIDSYGNWVIKPAYNTIYEFRRLNDDLKI